MNPKKDKCKENPAYKHNQVSETQRQRTSKYLKDPEGEKKITWWKQGMNKLTIQKSQQISN